MVSVVHRIDQLSRSRGIEVKCVRKYVMPMVMGEAVVTLLTVTATAVIHLHW